MKYKRWFYFYFTLVIILVIAYFVVVGIGISMLHKKWRIAVLAALLLSPTVYQWIVKRKIARRRAKEGSDVKPY